MLHCERRKWLNGRFIFLVDRRLLPSLNRTGAESWGDKIYLPSFWKTVRIISCAYFFGVGPYKPLREFGSDKADLSA